MYIDINEMSPDAETWVFPCKEKLSISQQEALRDELVPFLDTWSSHDRPLWASLWLDSYQIVLFVDKSKASPSGCALDKWTRTLREVANKKGIDPFYYEQVLCSISDEHKLYSAEKALSAWKRNELSDQTLIADVGVKSKAAFFSPNRFFPLAQSWLSRKKTTSAPILWILGFMFSLLFGCSPMKKAEKHIQNKEYHPAIEQYRKLLKRKPKDPALNYQLAEALRKINRLHEARPYYEQSIAKYPEAIPYYVASLKAHTDYAAARQVIETSLRQSDLPQETKDRLNSYHAQLAQLQILQNEKGYYRVEKLDGINTSQSEYAPFLRDSWLYFVSTRQKGRAYATTGQPYSALFRVKMKGNNKPRSATLKPLADDFDGFNIKQTNTGPLAFYPKGDAIIFARGNPARGDSEKIKEVNLFYSQYRRKKWSNPKLFSVSETKAWDSSPAITPDGLTLYFSSTREGGQGGADLYKVTRSRGGKWSKPENLGEPINTPGNEVFPHVSPDNKIYFASDGHAGFGGLDLFVVEREESKIQLKNLGHSMNSAWDDFALFATTPDEGFFSSNRPGGAGDDDIYSYRDTDPKLKILFLYLDVAVFSSDSTALPLSDALVTVYNKKGELVDKKTTDEKGHCTFQVQEHTEYSVRAKKIDYLARRVPYSTYNKSPNLDTIRQRIVKHTLHLPIPLDPIVLQQAIVLNDIYYDFNKANIRDDAKPALDSLLTLMRDNGDITIELSSHTDSRNTDEYNIDLSQRRAQSVVNYLIQGGIEENRLLAKGYGETQFRIPNAQTEEEHQVNRRTEFKVLTYDRAKFILRQKEEIEAKDTSGFDDPSESK